MAAAAAMTGDMRWVRPWAPWRPSKLRLLVLAQRSLGDRMSGFMPRHMLQPASRHSKPASRNTRSSPSASACFLTRPEPGTTMARMMLGATLRPLTTRAAARRSSMRELVHEPMKTLSTTTSSMGVPGTRPMYSSMRRPAAFLASVGNVSGSGTRPVMGTTSSGLVPQVTVGTISRASTKTSTS
ncbi:hypothetical protein VTK73DRAFT_5835 [Phialemonium thermophilum]|uniref:Uncharacterized protein n=1 Tax=Phialemonium thermophilum TaxID=223376 RepID=A0ABR3WM96_9PEZI